jgi:alpha/beta superfamily hydrolase
MNDVIFKGPGCKLKGMHYQNKDVHAPVAVVLCPELRGGEIPFSIKSAMDCLLNKGFSVFFFDFTRINHFINDPILKREEELNELISALDWVNKKHYTKKALWMLSFYSTTWVGLQIVMRRPEITDYILFSPPPKLKDFGFVVPCSAVGLIMYETTRPNSVDEIVEKLLAKSDSKVDTIPFPFIDMNKPENAEKIVENLDRYVDERLNKEAESGERKIRRDRRRRRKKKESPEDEKTIRISPVKALEFD